MLRSEMKPGPRGERCAHTTHVRSSLLPGSAAILLHREAQCDPKQGFSAGYVPVSAHDVRSKSLTDHVKGCEPSDLFSTLCFGDLYYRGTSLIRNRTLPGTTVGPWAYHWKPLPPGSKTRCLMRHQGAPIPGGRQLDFYPSRGRRP